MYGTTITELGSALDQVEDSINFGEKARLQFVSDTMPTRQELNQFYNDLVSAGFHTSRPSASIKQGLASTEIILRKGSPQWVALIAMIPTVLVVGLIAFGITKIGDISKALIPVLLIVGGTAVAVAIAAGRPALQSVALRRP